GEVGRWRRARVGKGPPPAHSRLDSAGSREPFLPKFVGSLAPAGYPPVGWKVRAPRLFASNHVGATASPYLSGRMLDSGRTLGAAGCSRVNNACLPTASLGSAMYFL